jgi:hypothetical protein
MPLILQSSSPWSVWACEFPVVPLIASTFGTASVVLFVRNTSSLPDGIELMVRGLVRRS